jgi:hypothetical protein
MATLTVPLAAFSDPSCMYTDRGCMQVWPGFVYSRYGYTYSSLSVFILCAYSSLSIFSILRCMCVSQAARIGFPDCMNALAGFLCASCRRGLTACTLCMATRMRPVCCPCLDRLGLTACTLCMATCMRPVCFSFLGAGAPPRLQILVCLAACTPLLASLCVSCRLGLTACTFYIATCMRPVCFPCLDARAPAGLHVLIFLAA